MLSDIMMLIFAIGYAAGTVQSNRFKRSVWGYETGLPPSKWAAVYPTCGGKSQSPIDVKTDKVVVDPALGKFDLSRLYRIRNVELSLNNNGHTVEVSVGGKNKLSVRGGGFKRPYIVEQFHFHWGLADARGSEHDVNGQFFPMEMHIVTYASKFKRFDKAKKDPAGFAVLSFLFIIGDENPAFDELTDNLRNVQHKDDVVKMKTFSLASLLPKDREVFYRYNGSLTTPPCTENVIWSIFKSHITISERQVNDFRTLSNRHFGYKPLSDNFRPTQPLNHRTVWTNKESGLHYNRDDGSSHQDKNANETGNGSSSSDSSDSNSDKYSSDSNSDDNNDESSEYDNESNSFGDDHDNKDGSYSYENADEYYH